MANAYKVLGQTKPSAASLSAAYTVPSSTEAILSTITVCNQSATATSFRVAVDVGGSGIEDKDYLYYDVAIAGNDTFAATLGIALAATDVVRVYNTLATLSFNITGVEIT